MLHPYLFISYRRTDSQHAALALHAQLREKIGLGSVFMDRSGIPPGEIWPESLHEAASKATVMLALIGPGWLNAADEFFRRRIDDPDDWVVKELSTAIENNKPILPVLFGEKTKIPEPRALPAVLERVSFRQSYTLRDDHWDLDLNELVNLLVANYGFRESEPEIRVRPDPLVRVSPLTQPEIDAALGLLRGWEQVESMIPHDYPKSRQEIRRVYSFPSFESAMKFMGSAAVAISELQHHPRWENQWRTVTVYLCTWDIGSRVSQLDIGLATRLDALYAQSLGPPGTSST
jgi:pterin-4a-carbinolamine dehydratase